MKTHEVVSISLQSAKWSQKCKFHYFLSDHSMYLLVLGILCSISSQGIGKGLLFRVLCLTFLYFCHISLLAYLFLVLKKCPDPNTQFLVALLMHPIPLKHATKISLQQIFSLLMTLSFFTKIMSLVFLYWSWCLKLLFVPTLTLFVPTLTPLFCPLYFTQKCICQNSKQLRELFIVLWNTHMQCIAKINNTFNRYDF